MSTNRWVQLGLVLVLAMLVANIIFKDKFSSLFGADIRNKFTPLLDVNFDESNGLFLLEKHNLAFLQPKNIVDLKLRLLRENYELNKPSKMIYSDAPIIPKIIHIIWLGGNALPSNFEYYLNTWKRFHPNWQIRVWHHEDIVKESFPSYDLYSLAGSYAERADIIRYEILYKYGGLYIDADIECLSNFDEFHHKYEFYINLEPPVINKSTIQVVNAMIGSVSGNSIFLDALKKIRREWHNNTALFIKNFANYPLKSARSKHHLAVRRTMIPFSDVVFEYLLNNKFKETKSIILPIGYNMPFYPIADDYSFEIVVRPETRSIHHYDKSNSIIKYKSFAENLFDFDVLVSERVEVLNSQRYLFLNFQDLYRDHFPTEIAYNFNPQIPEKIYLYNGNNLQVDELLKLKRQWLDLNPFIQIEDVREEDLINLLPNSFKSLKYDVFKDVGKFYFLNYNGGILVESSFTPFNLQEFNYKYKFYGFLNTVEDLSSRLGISLAFIASSKKHAIITQTINDIEERILKNRGLDTATLQDLFLENIYKYNLIDGKNIVFPMKILEQKH